MATINSIIENVPYSWTSDDVRNAEILAINNQIALLPFNDLPDSEWKGLAVFNGRNIWTDEDNVYYSYSHVLDKTTSTWNVKTWNGMTAFTSEGKRIWTDGISIYYSNGATQKILNKQTSTWSNKSWVEFPSFSGQQTWSDGTNIYYSGSDGTNLVLYHGHWMPKANIIDKLGRLLIS